MQHLRNVLDQVPTFHDSASKTLIICEQMVRSLLQRNILFVEYLNQLIPLLSDISVRKSLSYVDMTRLQNLGERITNEARANAVDVSRIVSEVGLQSEFAASNSAQQIDEKTRAQLYPVTSLVACAAGRDLYS